jgi:hypothetical protein
MTSTFNPPQSLPAMSPLRNKSFVAYQGNKRITTTFPQSAEALFAFYMKALSCNASGKILPFAYNMTSGKVKPIEVGAWNYTRTTSRPSEKNELVSALRDSVVKVFLEASHINKELDAIKNVLEAISLSHNKNMTEIKKVLAESTPFVVVGNNVIFAIEYTGIVDKAFRAVQRRFDDNISKTINMGWAPYAVTVIAPLLVTLHRQGVYHCDIKPLNILFDRQKDRVALCDFGAAKKMNGPVSSHVASVFHGATTPFLPPELYAAYLIRLEDDQIRDKELKKALVIWKTCLEDFDLLKKPEQPQYEEDDYEDVRVALEPQERYDASIVLRNHFEAGIRLAKDFLRDKIVIPYEPPPMWFLDCYALGLTLFLCGYNVRHVELYEQRVNFMWPWLVATHLMQPPNPDEGASLDRLVFAMEETRFYDIYLYPQSEKPEVETTMYDALERRKVGQGSFGAVYSILDQSGMAMLMCNPDVRVNIHCFDPRTNKQSVIRPTASTESTQSMVCIYHEGRKEAAEMWRASRSLCRFELTRTIFPDKAIDGTIVKLLGLDVGNVNLVGQPTMLLYLANMDDGGVPDSQLALESLREFLYTAHRANVIHGSIHQEVLVKIAEDRFGIVGFPHVVSRASPSFYKRAFEDQVMLHKLFPKAFNKMQFSEENYSDNLKEQVINFGVKLADQSRVSKSATRVGARTNRSRTDKLPLLGRPLSGRPLSGQRVTYTPTPPGSIITKTKMKRDIEGSSNTSSNSPVDQFTGTYNPQPTKGGQIPAKEWGWASTMASSSRRVLKIPEASSASKLTANRLMANRMQPELFFTARSAESRTFWTPD